MNGLPEPYPNRTHVKVRGRVYVIREHAPNADGWRYTGIPADLIGDVVHFSHEEATPVPARLVVEGTETSPIEELLRSLADAFRRNRLDPDTREAFIIYKEATP